MKEHDIFTDFLQLLGVRHTRAYSSTRFAALSFPTLFGLRGLLKEYGVESRGLQLARKEDIVRLRPPFIACVPGGLVIVSGVDKARGNVSYLTQGIPENIPYDDFLRAWDGTVFTATPGPAAGEPDYGRHRFADVMKRLRNLGGIVGALLIFCYFFVTRGVCSSWALIVIAALDVAGLAFSFMLVQKTLNIHTRAADRVCGVLEQGGCDTVLRQGASTFLGIFHWSEVGLSYFGVSLAVLLLFPQHAGALAAVNLLCLPYTLWSIWYQRFRARAWCTLCVSVQATLWALFAFYLAGGCYRTIFPIGLPFFMLLVAYGAALCLLNRLTPFLTRPEN